ncbi:MAG: M56 family metallopeptidase [Evtepia sp.]
MWDYLFFKLVFLSLAFGISGSLILLCTRLFAKRLTKTQCYYLWLIPFLLAILPSIGGIPRSMGEVQLREPQTVRTPIQPTVPQQTLDTPTMVQPAPQAVWGGISQPTKTLPMPNAIPYTQIFCILWLVGMAGIGLYHAIYRIVFRRKMREASTEADEAQKLRVQQCGLRFGKVSLKTISADMSPFVTGLLKPIIVLPNSVQDEGLRPILLHELTHLKRCDLLYALFVQTILVIHFFNPLAYVFAKEVRRLAELSCDETVCKHLTAIERKRYAATILDMMRTNPPLKVPNRLCLSEGAADMKERLRVIMKTTKQSKARRMTAVLLTLAILCSATVLAATVNEQNPSRNSYMFNKVSDTGYFSYLNRDEEPPMADTGDMPAGMGKGKREISLVNTPFYKSFYAKILIPDYSLQKGSGEIAISHEAENAVKNVAVEIRMDRFEKALNHNNDWVGQFTVTLNGAIIADHMRGYISNIPSAKKADEYSRVTILDEKNNQRITLDGINFNLVGDDMINASYDKIQIQKELEADPATKTAYINRTTRAYCDGIEYQIERKEQEQYSSSVRYNATTSQVDCEIDTTTGISAIQSISTEQYQCTADTIMGKFLVMKSGCVADEFEGTISGLSGKIGDTVQVTSKDQRYQLEYTVGSYEHSEDQMEAKRVGYTYTMPEAYATSPDPAERKTYEDGKFVQSAKQSANRMTAAMMPFTVTLNPDKTSISVKLKAGLPYDGWCAVLATYRGNEGLWEEKLSKSGDTEWVYPLDVNPTTHYLEFSAYKKVPYIHMEEYELAFRLVNGTLFYTNCIGQTFDNPNYGVDEGYQRLYDTVYPERRFVQP